MLFPTFFYLLRLVALKKHFLNQAGIIKKLFRADKKSKAVDEESLERTLEMIAV